MGLGLALVGPVAAARADSTSGSTYRYVGDRIRASTPVREICAASDEVVQSPGSANSESHGTYDDRSNVAFANARLDGCALAPRSIRNPVPGRVARVVDARVLDRGATRLGAPGTDDVFVTGADDIAGLSSSDAIAQRLTLLDNAGQARSGLFAILEFDTPAGIASPVFR